MGSILNETKEQLGVQEDATYFDSQIIMCINTALFVLGQLRVIPRTFLVEDNTQTWDGLGIEDQLDLSVVKSQVYIRTRLLFDPPNNSFLVNSLNKQIEEFEWRISIQNSGGENGSE